MIGFYSTSRTKAYLKFAIGKACASHNKLISFPAVPSNESILADLGNFGGTLPTGSDDGTVIVQVNYK